MAAHLDLHGGIRALALELTPDIDRGVARVVVSGVAADGEAVSSDRWVPFGGSGPGGVPLSAVLGAVVDASRGGVNALSRTTLQP